MSQANQPYKSESNALLNAAFFRSIIDSLPEAIQVYKTISDADFGILGFEVMFASKRAKIFFPEYLPEKKLLFTQGAVDGSHDFLEKLKRIIATGKEYSGTLEIITEKKLVFNERILKFGDGVLVLRMLVDDMSDGEEHDNSETDGLTEANLIRGISETSADLLYIMDIDTRHIFFYTRNIAKVLGYSPERIEKMKEPLFELMYEEDVPLMLEHIANMKTATYGEVREIEYRMKHADGTLHFFRDRNTVFKRDENDMPVEKLGISQDITKDHLRGLELAKNHSLLQQSEELAGSGTWEYNCNTKEFTWSDGMYRLFELPIGTPVRPSVYIDNVIPEDMEIAKKMVDIIENTFEPADLTLRIKPGQTVRTLRIKTALLKDKKRKSNIVLGVDMDTTYASASQQQIQGLNKTLSTKSRELETMHSELTTFNNIAENDYKETLRSLYINLENVIKSDASELSDSGKANIRKAQTAIQKMKLLTEDIVSFSRIPMLDSSSVEVDLNESLKTSIADLDEKIKESGATIEVGNLPVIQGMPLLLTLLFYHILDNAIKFRDGTKVPQVKVVGSDADSTANIEIGIHYKVITISDNGIGFDGAQSEKLFAIFFRLHDRSEYRGSGIGLAVCRKIMALHGGYITAEGIPGDGAVIKCFFPVELD
jgi:PAS domain S-box-containing protein